MSDRLLLPESLVMLHPERLEETWVTWGWIPSARAPEPISANLQKQHLRLLAPFLSEGIYMPEMQPILLGDIRERKQSPSLGRYRDLELDTETGSAAKKTMLDGLKSVTSSIPPFTDG
ncbi:uncharacterized [Tachysurus ichikawai]